jgi:hypothetical protein
MILLYYRQNTVCICFERPDPGLKVAGGNLVRTEDVALGLLYIWCGAGTFESTDELESCSSASRSNIL